MGALVEALSHQPPLPPMRRRGVLLRQGLDAAAAALDRRDQPERVAAARPEVAFRDFIAVAWRVVEPATEFKANWHIDAIAEHLEAVTAGEIRRLLINMPPRHAKSLLVSVFWPTWVWTFRPSLRWLFASYFQGLSTRDSVKCRRIIESPWYRERWGKVFTLTSDQNQKTRFENDRTGYRLATSVDGSATGEGGDCLVADDPHNAKKAESDADRQSKLDWFDQVWSTRLNDQKTGAMVTVMQRVHHRDISGHILELGGWTHLCLPTEFEVKRRCITVPLGGREEPWEDPRSAEGELLFAERFGDKEVADAKKLGSYFYAGQHQQRPSPKQGGIWQRDWWRRYHTPKCGHVVPAEQMLPERFDVSFQSWDMTFKDLSSSDYVVGQVWGSVAANLYLRHQLRKQLSFTATCKALARMSEEYPDTDAKLVEDKANGTAVMDTLRDKIPGLIAIEPDGGKVARAIAASPTIESGNVWIPCDESADWVGEFVEECTSFPNAAHDDSVDGASQAIRRFQRMPVAAAPSVVETTSYWGNV